MNRKEIVNKLIKNSKKGICEELPIEEFESDTQDSRKEFLEKFDNKKEIEEKPIKKGGFEQ